MEFDWSSRFYRRQIVVSAIAVPLLCATVYSDDAHVPTTAKLFPTVSAQNSASSTGAVYSLHGIPSYVEAAPSMSYDLEILRISLPRYHRLTDIAQLDKPNSLSASFDLSRPHGEGLEG